MWPVISGINGRLAALKTYLDTYLSPAKSAALDLVNSRLNDTISSRAPASTALSTAQWTNTRAAKLDNIATPLTQRRPTSLDSYTKLSTTSVNQFRPPLSATTGTAVNTTWTTKISSSTAGYIDLFVLTVGNNESPATYEVEFTMDGVVLPVITVTGYATGGYTQICCIVGTLTEADANTSVWFVALPDRHYFNTGLTVRVRRTTGGTVAAGIYYRYRELA